MRRATKYPESIAATVSPERLQRFFVKTESGYQVAGFMREMCIFSRQDVTKAPPLSRMDLISCRNLLIYFGPILQRRVLAIFSYSLQPQGCLLLGNSENLGTLAEHFVVLDAKHKIYGKNLQMERPDFDLPSRTYLPHVGSKLPSTVKPSEASMLDRVADGMLLDEYAPSGFVINSDRQIVKFRSEIGPFLAPQAGDPSLDILKLVREEIAAPLESAVQEARAGDLTVRREQVKVRYDGGVREFHLVVRPIDAPGSERHFLISFENALHQPHEPASMDRVVAGDGHRTQDYQNLALELSATRSYMQRLIEELRSANEEAQSSNEELQSTNEELQTAKEELQSSNEELTTTNEEMQSRNRDLGRLNNDLTDLLSSMRVPIVMLDSGLRIRRHTPLTEKVLNLIPTDIGRPISDLKPRINVPDLEDLLHTVIRTVEPLEREVQDQEGHWSSLRIHPYRTTENKVEGAVLQLVDIDLLKRSSEEVMLARDYAEAIIETVRQPLLVLDQELRIQTANRAFFETFALSHVDIDGRKISEIDRGQWNLSKVTELFEGLGQDGTVKDVEVERSFERLGDRTFRLYARRVHRPREAGLILLAMEDVTDRKKTAEAKYRRLFEAAKDGMVILDAENGEITDVNPFFLELFGYDRAELVGKEFWKAEPLHEIEGAHEAFDRLRKQEIVRFPEITLKAKDKREIIVEVVANVYREGEKWAAQFNIRDITERKHFDQQMQQTVQLESLGILAGGIAHDFNNLLAGILGNAGLALSEAPRTAPTNRRLKMWCWPASAPPI